MAAKGQDGDTRSDADLMAVGSHGIARAYPRNTIIVSEGDKTDSLYIILEGKVKAFVADGEGHEMVLSTQGPGEYFGDRIARDGRHSVAGRTGAAPIYCPRLVIE